MKFSVFQLSRKGGRERNEDRMGYCYTRQAGLFVLADGMGGHPEGEVAAQLAVQTLSSYFRRHATPELPETEAFFHTAIRAAHRQILRYAFQKGLPDSPRTTLVAAVVQSGMIQWAHCGDSRLYFVRQGALMVRTRDHSLLEQHLDSPHGKDTPPPTNRNVLYTCLGSPVKPVYDISAPLPLEQGDRFLLCSDGIWGNLEEERLVQGLAEGELGAAAPRLVEQALLQGGSSCDNATLVAVAWNSPSEFESTAAASLASDLDETGFSSTVQAADLLDTGGDDLDEDDIERSIAEINDAIRRSTASKP